MTWVYDPHSGGTKIPDATKKTVEQQITEYANKHCDGNFIRLKFRYRSQFCYVDAYIEPSVSDDFIPPDSSQTRDEFLEKHRNTPMQICRLRHFSKDSWSTAYFSYASMKFESTMLEDGSFTGTPEQCFEASAMLLMS